MRKEKDFELTYTEKAIAETTESENFNFDPNSPATALSKIKSKKYNYALLIPIVVMILSIISFSGIRFIIPAYIAYTDDIRGQIVTQAQEQAQIILAEAEQGKQFREITITEQLEQIKNNEAIIAQQQGNPAVVNDNRLLTMQMVDRDINTEIRDINQMIFSNNQNGPERRKNLRVALLKFSHVLTIFKNVEETKGVEERAREAAMIVTLDSQSFALKGSQDESWFDIKTLNYFIYAVRDKNKDINSIITLFNNAFEQCLRSDFIIFPKDLENHDVLLSQIREAVSQLQQN